MDCGSRPKCTGAGKREFSRTRRSEFLTCAKSHMVVRKRGSGETEEGRVTWKKQLEKKNSDVEFVSWATIGTAVLGGGEWEEGWAVTMNGGANEKEIGVLS